MVQRSSFGRGFINHVVDLGLEKHEFGFRSALLSILVNCNPAGSEIAGCGRDRGATRKYDRDRGSNCECQGKGGYHEQYPIDHSFGLRTSPATTATEMPLRSSL